MTKKIRRWLIAALFALVLLIDFCWYENNHLDITTYDLDYHLGTDIKIMQLSDLHGKQFRSNNKPLIHAIDRFSPDLIAVTGDAIDRHGENLSETLDFLESLAQRYPVFYVFGNHEMDDRVRDTIYKRVTKDNLCFLNNEMAEINVRGVPVHILGLNERSGWYDHDTNVWLFEQLAQMGGLRLVLSHYPENYALIKEANYQQYDFDLMLSGHAHGGQWRLPLIGAVFSPGQGWFPKYTAGVFGDHPQLIVSRGLGNSSFPLRLFNHPELVEITIH